MYTLFTYDELVELDELWEREQFEGTIVFMPKDRARLDDLEVRYSAMMTAVLG